MSASSSGPLFDNCVILAPDGVLLGRCERKRLDWYLSRDIAELVDPNTIRLKFEPSGRRGVNDPFNQQGKPNLCIVCGTTKDLSRHHVIPHAIVKFFPDEFKEHNGHDVLPLCVPCHNQYEAKSHEKKQALADQFGVSIAGHWDSGLKGVSEAIADAKSLRWHGDKMPAERRQEMLNGIRAIMGNISDQEIVELSNQTFTKARSDFGYRPLGKILVDGIEDLNAFAVSWRQHFVDVMQPKYLPEFWDINRQLGGR